ncbi:hypothetical protein HYN69_08665 [Gemmobacter aquarius]|uniref:Uncharacterized protein n=1 Tax=Paragemmobacter aquarius TaxID=2169400 RepID=A0A2S0UR61_9RHOB|nr:hypothetical protein HYN69_08665 [Gemmobacter aquarius]
MPLSLALLATAGLTACGSSTEIRMYPVSGPLALEQPLPVIEATAKNADGASGNLKFRLPDGTRCDGTWASVAPKVVSRNRGLSIRLSGPGGDLGGKTETVGGVNPGELFAVCRDNTQVQGDFVMGSGTTSGTGQATDTRGNAYRLLF